MNLIPCLNQYQKLSFDVTTGVVILGLVISCSVSSQPLHPSNQDDSAKQVGSQNGWGVGLAAISNQQSIEGIDRDTMLIPIVTFENEYVRWFGPNIDIKLPEFRLNDEQHLEFSLTGGFDFGGYDEDEAEDTPILQGMEERKGSFAIGAGVKWNNPWVEVEAKWLTDISGDREANRVTLNFERNWMFYNKIILSPHLGITWLDDNFVNFHYGVRSNEVRSDRLAYTGEATVNFEYGLRTAYLIDQSHSVMLDFSVTSLGNEITNSPLVDSSTENNLLIFYMYKF